MPGETAQFPGGAAADLWRHTLVQIPTTFGRLVYLASLRDQNTGHYEHFGLEQMFGFEEADRTLRECHQQAFSEWLCFPLEHQKSELDEYLASLDGPLALILQNWIRFAPYRNFVPAGTRDVERMLYLSDLDTLLELLKREHGVASPDSEA